MMTAPHRRGPHSFGFLEADYPRYTFRPSTDHNLTSAAMLPTAMSLKQRGNVEGMGVPQCRNSTVGAHGREADWGCTKSKQTNIGTAGLHG